MLLLHVRWWIVAAMTDGRSHRRRKMMGRGANGGCGTGEKHCPISSSTTRVPTKGSTQPGGIAGGVDFYAQASKSLSLVSPFDLEDAQKKSGGGSSLSIIPTLPSGLANCLSRHSDSSHRKRHKKSHHLGSETKKKNSSNKSSKPRGFNFWSETEDYFRELRVDDIDRLKDALAFKDLKFLSIKQPNGGNDIPNEKHPNGGNDMPDEQNSHGGVDMPKQENSRSGGGGLVPNEEAVAEEHEEAQHFMEVDEVGANEILPQQEEEKPCSLPESCSGVEWLLGSQNKVYLTSERPSKKRKLLGGEAGLQKLCVARPVKQEPGKSLLCHYCGLGDIYNQLNRLIVCSSCGVAVHQRCYGVQQDDEAGCWLCSWCSLKKDDSKDTLGHCVLCPQQGGALKPVLKTGVENDNDFREEFAHLFCCQWMPEVYIEDIKKMEPILNIEGIKETRRKLICYLCKVKCGACLRCSNGACRTSFHPICAREARHRMEIWGKFGCDDVELRAFCSKHSEIQLDGGQQVEDVLGAVGSDSTITEHQPTSPVVNEPQKLKIGRRNGDKFVLHREAVDMELDKLGSGVSFQDGSPGTCSNSKDQPEFVDNQQPKQSCKVESCRAEDVKVPDSLNFTLILKKLIDRGKVNLKDVASDIGVSPDSLASELADEDDSLVPDLHCKIVKWLKSHAHIGTLPKHLKLKIKSRSIFDAEKESSSKVAVKASENNVGNSLPFKSVPPRMRTKGNIRMLKDKNLKISFKRSHDDGGIVMDEDKNGCLVNEDPKFQSEESFPDAIEKVSDESREASYKMAGSARCSSPSHSGSGQAEEAVSDCYTMRKSYLGIGDCSFADDSADAIMEALPGSNVHPLILNKFSLMQNQDLCEIKVDRNNGSRDREVCTLEASSSSGICCNNQRRSLTSAKSSGQVTRELFKTKRMSILDVSPVDEVQGELVYYQHKLLCNAVARKHFNDGLICKVVKRLPQEINAQRERNWDAVLVNQYLYELREAKKQGRKERRHKEAQAVLAAATAAAAASSRLSSFRKDTVDESSHQNLMKLNAFGGRSAPQQMPQAHESLPKLAVVRVSPENNSLSAPSISNSKEHPRVCDICRRTEILLNPIFVCSSCKVAVHIDCYRSVKDTKGPWYCELCEDMLSSRSRDVPALNSLEMPRQVAECSLCGGTSGAFRKSSDGQWVHAFCAEWVLESTFRRGQVKPVEGMETISRGSDLCLLCSRKQGVCIKCNYGHCQSTFHPSCGRSAGFFMNVRSSGGKTQHKAYCEKHSYVERTKAEAQKHGVEELNSLKKVRVELERLRLICERIIRREKLKRELVVCSHDILCWNRDSVSSSTRASDAFLSPDLSSESATTSLRGYVDSYKSCSETIQRSDDSTVASKRRKRFPMSMDNDQKTDDSSTSQLLTQIPLARPSFSGKQIPHRPIPAASHSTSDNGEKCIQHRKHTETFEKELVMTSDQASMRNQRLPKGFVYVPIHCLSNEKETAAAASSEETSGDDG